jgi:two-component system, cell cycle sensor histidine kinase and response regulator CckA
VNGINEQLNGTNAPASSADALKTDASPWRSMFEESSLGIAKADLEGRFIDANRAYGKLTGYSNAELGTLRLVDLVVEDDRPPVRI